MKTSVKSLSWQENPQQEEEDMVDVDSQDVDKADSAEARRVQATQKKESSTHMEVELNNRV